MAERETTELRCPFCSTVVFTVTADGRIEEDFTESSPCPHFAGIIDDEAPRGAQPGFEPLIEARRLLNRYIVRARGAEQDLQAALAAHPDALSLVRRLDLSREVRPSEWLRAIPGVRFQRQEWPGGDSDFVFADEQSRRHVVPILRRVCSVLEGLLGKTD